MVKETAACAVVFSYAYKRVISVYASIQAPRRTTTKTRVPWARSVNHANIHHL